MGEIFAYIFIAVWFVYWGWMLIHKPETVKAVNDEWNKNMDKVGKVAGKAVVMGLKAAARTRK